MSAWDREDDKPMPKWQAVLWTLVLLCVLLGALYFQAAWR